MTIAEIQEVLAAKDFKLYERIDYDSHPESTTLWAHKSLSVQQHYLGTKNALLQEPLDHFLASWRYQEIGRSREEIVDTFVTEWIKSVEEDYVYEGNRENLCKRVLRLYDELRRADW